MVEHTPGPWTVVEYDGSLLINGEKSFVCTLEQTPGQEQTANGCLIAAAPVLLDALIKLSNEVAGWEGYELELRQIAGNTNFVSLMERVHEARAAIAEATEQS